MQLLDKIDAAPTGFDNPVTTPPGNDGGRIEHAIKALLTCEAKNLGSNRLELQLAYCAYYDISDNGISRRVPPICNTNYGLAVAQLNLDRSI